MNALHRIPLNGAVPTPPGQGQRGQAMSEYLVIVVALVIGVGGGLFGDGGGLFGVLIDALRTFHGRFSMALSWPF